MVGLEIKRK